MLASRMESKQLLLDDTSIDYFESQGSKGTILFIHGNSSSKGTFDKQLNSPLATKYRCIALDLPGHGNSSRCLSAADEAFIYTISYYADIITSFLNKLHIKMPVLVGHSLGAHIATSIAKKRPLSGLVLYQNTPLEKAEQISKALREDPIVNCLFSETVPDTDIAKLAKLYSVGNEYLSSFCESFKKTDPRCRLNHGRSVTPHLELKEVSTLKTLQCPLTIFHGSKDKLIKFDYLKDLKLTNLWDNEIKIFSHSGHFPHKDESTLFNQYLDKFVEYCLLHREHSIPEKNF